MADSALTVCRKVDEMIGRVRRTLGDIGPRDPVVSPNRIREIVLSNYVEVVHDVGWDARTEEDYAGVEEWTVNLNPGDYRSSARTNKEPIAFARVYNNQSVTPMEPIDLRQLQAWVQNDVRATGAVQRGIPWAWAPETYFNAATGKMEYRFNVYPAANRTMTVYVPHTVLDMNVLETSSATSMLSYIAHEVWLRRCVGQLVLGLSKTNHERLGTSEAWAKMMLARAELDLELAQKLAQGPAYVDEIQELGG